MVMGKDCSARWGSNPPLLPTGCILDLSGPHLENRANQGDCEQILLGLKELSVPCTLSSSWLGTGVQKAAATSLSSQGVLLDQPQQCPTATSLAYVQSQALAML